MLRTSYSCLISANEWLKSVDPSIARSLMARVKVLKGVAHSIGSSFTSLMNYAGDDYSIGHILRFARESGIDTLTIDLLNEHGEPALLLQEPISRLPSWYSKMFLRLVESAGSNRELIRSAVLKVAYDLRRNQPSPIQVSPKAPMSAMCLSWTFAERNTPPISTDGGSSKEWNSIDRRVRLSENGGIHSHGSLMTSTNNRISPHMSA